MEVEENKNSLRETLKNIWEKDPAKLLLFLKNFITRRKYQYAVDVCLEMVLTFNNVTNLEKLSDQVKSID